MHQFAVVLLTGIDSSFVLNVGNCVRRAITGGVSDELGRPDEAQQG